MPAALTLEPFDAQKCASLLEKYPDLKIAPQYNTGFSLEDYISVANTPDMYVCKYQVKVKTTTNGLGGKLIRVAPDYNPSKILGRLGLNPIENPF